MKDALGRETRTDYDVEHHVTNTVDAAGHATRITYFANGLPQTVTGPRGDVTTYAYDAYGNPSSIARTDGGTETRTWNARGDLLTRTDANTNTTAFTYNGRRQMTSERDPFGKAVSNVYNDAGLLVTTIDKRGYSTTRTWTPTYKEKSIRYPDGGSLTNFYDAADRLVAVRDPMGFVASNRLDEAGRVVAVINPRGFATSNIYDQAGNLIAVRDPAGAITSNQYDSLNRLVRTTDALGFTVSNEYNAAGWLTATVDQEGKRTEYEHDSLGRVIVQRRGTVEHRFEYDASGNRMAYVNPKNARMGFGYDRMNRLVAETNALSQVTRYVFDPVGNLRQKINANGQAINYSYNALNLPTNRQSAIENVSFGYDPNGNMTNMVDALGTTRQTFDPMNRLAKVTDPFNQTVSNQYNLAGQRIKVTYPDGKTEQFAYNPNGGLTNVIASSFGFSTTAYSYNSRDNLSGAALPGGLTASYAYDSVNRLSSWSVSKAGSNLLARSFTRNGLGYKETEDIQAGLETLDGPLSQARAHNAADQITSIGQSTPSSTNIPSFDAAGNTTQVVLSVKGQTFTMLYRYDYDNRLLSVMRMRNSPQGQSVTTSVMQLEYDGQGLLLRITDNGTVRRLVRDRTDSLTRPLVEMDASGNAVRWFVWANARLLAQIGTNNVIRIAHLDELGRVLGFTDSNGVLVDEFAFSPYGRLLAHSGTTATPFTWLGSFGVWDAGHGLYLTRYRAYDANNMRWLSVDPIGINGLLARQSLPNLYVYGNASPLFYIDANGQWAGVDDAIALGAGAVIGLVGQGVADAFAGQLSDWEDYVGSAVGGAAMGETLLYAGPVAAGAAGGFAGNATSQGIKKFTQHRDFNAGELVFETGLGAVTGLIPGQKIAGVTSGRGSYNAVANQMITKIKNDQIENITTKTAGKIVTAKFIQGAALEGSMAGGMVHGLIGPMIPEIGSAIVNQPSQSSTVRPQK
ncbi:MAG TPA: hypothetical protein DCZ95_09250 [Verrucomicrobia bacterium]|nr:hypothetical protein [Verrucomicrobiota bacterium]